MGFSPKFVTHTSPNFKQTSVFYKPHLSFEPRVFISDFDGSVIEIDDEEKVINAVYLMTFNAPTGSAFTVGKRMVTALHDFHGSLGTHRSIGLMLFLNRTEKVSE